VSYTAVEDTKKYGMGCQHQREVSIIFLFSEKKHGRKKTMIVLLMTKKSTYGVTLPPPM
jgi:hypothetical protein